MSRFSFGSEGLGGPHYVFEDAPVEVVLSPAQIAQYSIAECASLADAIRIRDALAAATAPDEGGGA